MIQNCEALPDKSALRHSTLRKLRAIDPSIRREASANALAHLEAYPPFKRAKTVALFAPLPTEVDLTSLLHHRHTRSKRWLFPRVEHRTLYFYPIENLSELMAGAFGIKEPPPRKSAPWPLEKIDLFCVPGLAFTTTGQRLGRGGGYYDRILRARSAQSAIIGVGFFSQIHPHIPTEKHDIPTDALLTEEGIAEISR